MRKWKNLTKSRFYKKELSLLRDIWTRLEIHSITSPMERKRQRNIDIFELCIFMQHYLSALLDLLPISK
jgi:hypothetical protein